MTKGSFYHHFSDLPGFIDALMAYWAAEHATRLIALSESIADAHERFELLHGIAVGLPHDAEAAMRAWSWSDQRVAAVVHQVDQARLAHLTQAGIEAGLAPERARLMATISMGALDRSSTARTPRPARHHGGRLRRARGLGLPTGHPFSPAALTHRHRGGDNGGVIA